LVTRERAPENSIRNGCQLLQKRRQSLRIMQQTLSSVSGCCRRALELLLLHPEETPGGNEIARRTGLPSGTLTRELVRRP